MHSQMFRFAVPLSLALTRAIQSIYVQKPRRRNERIKQRRRGISSLIDIARFVLAKSIRWNSGSRNIYISFFHEFKIHERFNIDEGFLKETARRIRRFNSCTFCTEWIQTV